MPSIRENLTEIFKQAFVACGYEERFGHVVQSQRPDLCQFQCNGALAAGKQARKNPQDVAREVIAALGSKEQFSQLSIAGPGFVNISVADSILVSHCESLVGDSAKGVSVTSSPRTVVIDFSSVNVAKPMHVGHLRSSIIGDALQRIERFVGNNVIGDNHLGDWGTPMGMILAEIRNRNPELAYFNEDFTGEYPENAPFLGSHLEAIYPFAAKRFKEEPEFMAQALAMTEELQRGRRGYRALWSKLVALSIASFQEDYRLLGIKFDYWLGESFYHQYMSELVERLKLQGFAKESQGAVVIPVELDSDKKEVPPVMLAKSGGGFLYATSDLATIEYRHKHFHAHEILYVVDKRQSLHFEQVFRAARKTNLAPPELKMVHVGFGTVNGPGGTPLQTRAGGVMKLNDLIQQILEKARQRMRDAEIGQDLSAPEQEATAAMVGIAALKYADLMNHRLSDYVFDIDKFVQFEGKTGPYVQYTAVRIKSILRNAQKQGIQAGSLIEPGEVERSLMLLLAAFPDSIAKTLEDYAPNILCDYAYLLAQEFNRFYRECHILRQEDKKKQGSWLTLSTICLETFELLLQCMGIEIPDRM